MGVKGRLKDMSLVDIIQIFSAERKSAAIHLGSELGYGRVYIKNGSIVHAVHRGLAGTKAFFELLSWKDGEFEVEPDAVAPSETIHDTPEALILEGLRKLDESHKGKTAESRGYVGDIESIRLINRLFELGILEKM